MKTAPARIIVIEDDDAMRKSLVENIAVEADLEVVAQCATFKEGAVGKQSFEGVSCNSGMTMIDLSSF